MDEKKSLRKNLFSRIIYDFGNSFFTVAISTMFLAQWLILDNKLPDIWYGWSFALATLLVLISSPVLWAWSDKIERRMPFLKRSTIALIIINGLLARVTLTNLSNKIFVILWLSVVLQYFYQISLIFYNALLKNVSTEDTRGKIAWIGEWLGSLWRIVAILILLPFSNWTIGRFGNIGRLWVFFPSFVISTIFMFPMLIRFKEKKQPIIHATENIYRKTRAGIKQLWTTQKNVWLYLLAFSLISDIVLTMTLYLSIVMGVIYKVGDTMKSLILIIFLTISIIVGYIFGKLADRFGYKKLLVYTCWLLIAVTAIFFYSSAPWVLYVVWIVWWGASGWYFVVTKAFMTKLAPKWELGEYFWLYSTFQKAASITAPLIRWGITLWFIKYPIFKYQMAGTAMMILLIIWTFLMRRVREND